MTAWLYDYGHLRHVRLPFLLLLLLVLLHLHLLLLLFLLLLLSLLLVLLLYLRLLLRLLFISAFAFASVVAFVFAFALAFLVACDVVFASVFAFAFASASAQIFLLIFSAGALINLRYCKPLLCLLLLAWNADGWCRWWWTMMQITALNLMFFFDEGWLLVMDKWLLIILNVILDDWCHNDVDSMGAKHVQFFSKQSWLHFIMR